MTLETPVTPLCFVDTETDSLAAWRRPWDIAVIRREPDGTERTLQIYVSISLAETPDLNGLKIGRFWDRHPLGKWLSAGAGPNPMKDATLFPKPDKDLVRQFDAEPPTQDLYVTRETAAQLVARWTHGCHVVGAVPNFDTEVFAALLRDQQLIPAHHYHLIDVETLVVGYLHGLGDNPAPDAVGRAFDLPWDSEALSRAVGVRPAGEDERHTALGDARWAQRLWDRVTGGAA